ncbi:hypothetical protein GA0115254_124337 [Streptomyces sp. Ncost-T10-10d]|nr:hypothetical protein GA0115254_124337 [Streptomyces sp. Ncost-T10-10d]
MPAREPLKFNTPRDPAQLERNVKLREAESGEADTGRESLRLAGERSQRAAGGVSGVRAGARIRHPHLSESAFHPAGGGVLYGAAK